VQKSSDENLAGVPSQAYLRYSIETAELLNKMAAKSNGKHRVSK